MLVASRRAGKAELTRRSILPDDGQAVTRADRLEEPGRSNLTADCPRSGREHTHNLPQKYRTWDDRIARKVAVGRGMIG
jgi:hypothetical protein